MAYLDNEGENKYQTSGGSIEEEPAGFYETTFIVPPKLYIGDRLDPLHFDIADTEEDAAAAQNFAILGRYNSGLDTVEFALTGPTGTRFKVGISDGNSPYGWKAKRHGVIRSEPVVDDAVEGQEECFQQADILSVAHALMRSSTRQAILDAKAECVGPWSFYGPSLSETFCRCKVKVLVYAAGQRQNIRESRASMISPFLSLRTPKDGTQQTSNRGTAPPLPGQGLVPTEDAENGGDLVVRALSRWQSLPFIQTPGLGEELVNFSRELCEDWWVFVKDALPPV